METIKLTSPAGHNYEFPIADDTTITIDGEVIIFEKKKVEFKTGDVLFYDSIIFIFTNNFGDNTQTGLGRSGKLYINGLGFHKLCLPHTRLATEPEKQLLFDALAKDGKLFNFETMEVEDLKWKPKEGEEYWFFDGMSAFETYNECTNRFDIARIKIGNCFQTESECQEAIEEIKKILAK